MTEDATPKQVNSEQPGKAPTLTPPDATPAKEPKPSRSPLLIVAGGLLLVIAALLVVFMPLMNEGPVVSTSRQEIGTLKPQAPIQKQAVVIPQVPDQEAREIEQLLVTWLQKQAAAEAENVSAWGGDRYKEASSRGKECNQLVQEQEVLSARQACNQAITLLHDLMAAKESLVDEALVAGLLALEQGNQETATAYFQQALAIDAGEKRATAGIRRAEHLPTLLGFLQSGLAMEAAGDLHGALQAFSQAAAIDPEFASARQALARTKAVLAEQEFQQAMSRALQAMAEGRATAAATDLQKAASIRPGDPAVQNLKQQLLQTQRSQSLALLRQEAEQLEQQERWPEVLKTCTKALTLDAHAAFATSCKDRASLRADLDHQFAAIFAKPERLFTEGPRKEARQTFLYASQITPRGPKLASQIDRLDQLVTEAETEIEVLIKSDGLTDVTIYHVGRLGLFQEKQLILRTGNYTATGSRNGFRDVRQTLKVRPGNGQMVFTLRCEEPI